MKKKDIKRQIDLAMPYLPGHVRKYIRENVRIDICKIYTHKDGKDNKGYTRHGVFGLEPCSCCGEDIPTITIDSRIDTNVKRVFLHESAHAYLTYRKKKSNERRAHLLAQLWLMRGQRRKCSAVG